MDACEAYERFFDGISKFPRFKTKKRSKPSFYQDNIKIKFNKTHVKLEKITTNLRHNKRVQNWIRLVETDKIPFGENVKYYNPRITFDGLHWWISISFEESKKTDSSTSTEGVGIDLGIKDLATCSDGIVYPSINKTSKLKKLEKRKKALQNRVSRKYEMNKTGADFVKTKNIQKLKRLILKTSRKITNSRYNYLHQTTSEIIKRKPSFIVLEDLNVEGMLKNRYLSKLIQEQMFYEFRRQIEYKCRWNNVEFILADRWFPSSKLCSCCGIIKKDLKLSDRIYRCGCGNEIDRDYQASVNLKNYGERMLKST